MPLQFIEYPVKNRLGWQLVETPLGCWRVWFSSEGMHRLQPARENDEIPEGSYQSLLPAIWQSAILAAVEGRDVADPVPVVLRGTDFQQSVWRAICAIKRGGVMSYGALARHLGKPGAARAVGAACGANPLPLLIPCHRVVTSSGHLGGYAFGLELKRKLLRSEGWRSTSPD